MGITQNVGITNENPIPMQNNKLGKTLASKGRDGPSLDANQ